VRVLLANPYWERRLQRFLEESGVSGMMESGEDENEIRAAHMDGWMDHLGARGEGGGRSLI